MSLEIHPKCVERLTSKIAELLPNIIIDKGMFINRKSSTALMQAESVLPEHGDLKECLSEYISETPVFDFVYDFLAKELSEREQYSAEKSSVPLTEIEGYQDTVVIANKLVENFIKLPWIFSFTTKIENDFSEIFASEVMAYDLSDTINIVAPDETFEESYSYDLGHKGLDNKFGFGILSIYGKKHWDRSSAYLQIKMEGYIGEYGWNATFNNTISIIKQFFGLGIALRLFKANYSYRPSPVKSEILAHIKSTPEGWDYYNFYQIDNSLSETIADIVINDLDGKFSNDADKAQWIKFILPKMKTVFSNTDKTQKILLASQWLFDSHVGKNELLAFVQTTIALEILLGEKDTSDILGLGELLRNRCAYLIGESYEEREYILNIFKDIYAIRSRIVHRGKSKLSRHEGILFAHLRTMCRRVINAEIDLINKDD